MSIVGQWLRAIAADIARLSTALAVLAFLLMILVLPLSRTRRLPRRLGLLFLTLVAISFLLPMCASELTGQGSSRPYADTDPGSCASASTGLDACTLETGDILLLRGSKSTDRFFIENGGGSHFTHAGLVLRRPDGTVEVVEAPGHSQPPGGTAEVRRIPLVDSSWWAPDSPIDDWVVLRPPLGPEARATAAAAAAAVADDDSNVYDIWASKDDPHRWYCSKLVWAAYRSIRLDVEDDGNDIVDRVFASRWVTPDDLRRGGGPIQQAMR